MDLLNKLQQLKDYPTGLHLFCPRSGDSRERYYDEDLGRAIDDETPTAKEQRLKRIHDAEERKVLFLECLQILAFDGPDAEPYQKWLVERINQQMTSCDVCVRMYHKARSELRQQLEDQYSEEEVGQFLRTVFDRINIDRITKGLEQALADLRDSPPDERGIDCLQNPGIYAIFESLSCEPFLRNEQLLVKYFDEPFRLVQTKKRLRLQNSFVPAMTRFLFSSNETRQQWALFIWSKLKRAMTESEFDWAVKDGLFDVMQRIQMHCLDASLLPSFWEGARIIIEKLDKDLITHSLRAIEIDIYKLALDHLHLDSECFMDLIASVRLLLEKSPNDYWDAMGAISPVTIIEQVFSSPKLGSMMVEGCKTEDVDAAFAWVEPFLASINTPNITPACRALVNQLLDRFQSEKFAESSRIECEKIGLRVLVYTLRRLTSARPRSGSTRAAFVNAASVSEMLDLVDKHAKAIFATVSAPLPDTVTFRLGLDIIKHTLMLDCFALEAERDMVINGESLQVGTSTSCCHFWVSVTKAIRSGNIALPCTTLIGAKPLIGLEPLSKSGPKPENQEAHFNEKLKSFSEPLTEVLEKLNDFSADDLDNVFEDQEYANAVVHALFYSDESVHQAAVELLKTISAKDVRKDALNHILESFYRNSLLSVSDVTRRIGSRKAFAPMPTALKICGDMISDLCDPQDGYLRSQQFAEQTSVKDRYEATEKFWQALWQLLRAIFTNTEQWSNLGHDKSRMMDFCRDTMQFADRLFDQYGVFAAAIDEAYLETEQNRKHSEIVRTLLVGPTATFDSMVKWLRLRDEYLSTKAVGLTAKLLVRLKEVSMEIAEATLLYVEDIISGKVKAKLTGAQKAELERALETYTGRSSAVSKKAVKLQKDITSFFKSGEKADRSEASSLHTSDEEIDNALNKLIAQSTKGAETFKAKIGVHKKEPPISAPTQKVAQRSDQQISAFKLKRQQEMEEEKKRRAAALAKAKQNVPGADKPKGTGMYVSSDDSEEDEDDLDKELFGLTATRKEKSKDSHAKSKTVEILPQVPVKKKRQIRSVKDMRARLAPDLTPLHKTILGWDYFHDGDYPPKSRTDIYQAVPNTFRTPNDYQNIFMSLLTLEAWQGFVKAREEQTFKPYEVKIVNRATVDAFNEISSTMTHNDNKEINISEGDIILLSKAENPSASPNEPNCLARVFRIQRKKSHVEVSYRVMPGNSLSSSLNPGATVFGVKLESITTLEREYGALMGLQYYDLCDEIIRAKPSPLLNYSDKVLEPIISNYSVNTAQAKAVKSAIDNDAFTLIQGPPGSGKTKTIVAIVGALLTGSIREQGTTIERPKLHNSGPYQQGRSDNAPKKLLVCAPSNAAVDELVMRFKEGVKTLNGQQMQLKIVRLGRSEAINANVLDVTLEELVNKRLHVEGTNGSADQRQKTQELMKEHQVVSERLRIAREALDRNDAKGEEATKLKEEFDILRRRKALLGTRIDNARDAENTLDRQAELNRRRAQQQILDESHVICATLSASGHEMFQSLNIEFETVVVDEAAQCVEMSALIPLKYGCAKCILVGDPKQLPPTVFSKEAAKFQYEQSLFVRMQGNHPNDVHLLDTQYRMHPEISTFPSKTFYDGRLLDGPSMGLLREQPWHANAMLGPYRFFDVHGQHQAASKGHSLINIAEIEIALLLYEKLTSDFRNQDFSRKVGIITPYKSQLRELKTRFSRKYGPSILETVEFNTTDAFQGRESEIIIFSCVRASPAGGIGFLQDIRRMNVGLTRAKSSLWVLGNSQSLVRGEFWRKLVEDARSRNRYTDGDLVSLIRRSKPDGAVKWNLQGPEHMEGVEMGNTPDSKPSPPPHRIEPRFHPELQIKQEANGTQGTKSDMPTRRPSNNGNIRTVTMKVKREPAGKEVRTEQIKPPGEAAEQYKRKISFSDEDEEEVRRTVRESTNDSNTKASSRAASEASSVGSGAISETASIGRPHSSASNPGGLQRPLMKKKKPVDPFIRRPPPKKPKPH